MRKLLNIIFKLYIHNVFVGNIFRDIYIKESKSIFEFCHYCLKHWGNLFFFWKQYNFIDVIVIWIMHQSIIINLWCNFDRIVRHILQNPFLNNILIHLNILLPKLNNLLLHQISSVRIDLDFRRHNQIK